MTIAEQVAVILEAVDKALLQPDDVARWADSIIATADQPAAWLIEISALGSPHLQDYISRLEKERALYVPMRRQLEIIALAHHSGQLTLRDTLPLLFRVTITERESKSRDSLAESLVNALVSWDCQDDLDVIEPALKCTFERILREVLRNADEVAAVLPWKSGAEPGAAPNCGPAQPVASSGAMKGPQSVV